MFSDSSKRRRYSLTSTRCLAAVSRFYPHFLVALFAIPALGLLLGEQAFCTHDGNLHFYRLVALRHAIDQGLEFSRWTPGLVYGYGFPFFNFREIGSYYAPEALHLLGLTIPAAINLVYAGSLLLSGWGAYLLAHDIWRDRTAGLVAAVAYMAAPYQLLDVFVRGNLPESMALALLPWIVWLFRRLVDAPSALTFILATLSAAALLLTHNISSLLFFPMLIVYLAALLLLQRRLRALPDHVVRHDGTVRDERGVDAARDQQHGIHPDGLRRAQKLARDVHRLRPGVRVIAGQRVLPV